MLVSVASVAIVVSACADANDNVVLAPVVLGMEDTIAPTTDDGQTQTYQVERAVKMPFKEPASSDIPKGSLAPYPRLPYHVASDSRTTVRFTLTNLDDKPHNVDLLVDPWNEFVYYVPGMTAVRDDEKLPNFSGIQRTFVLAAKQRLEGIITPDDMVELATDLTTAMNLAKRPPDAMSAFAGAVLYNRAFNIQNRSSLPDPVLASWMPGAKSTVASVIGFDLGLRTAEKAKIAVELVIDVEDDSSDGKHVVIGSDTGKTLGKPGTALTPPVTATPQ